MDCVSEVPTRLINVLPDASNTSRICLHKGNSMEVRVHGYLALSYRWVGPQHLVLQKSSLSQLLHGLALSELPFGLQDAIILTRRLGYQYLWIDALCIIQDDIDDKSREMSKMQAYYRNAALTIQPSGMKSVSERFLGSKRGPASLADSSLPHASPMEMNFIDHDGVNYSIILAPASALGEYTAEKEPLNSRGWVLQERLLSPRVLILPSVGGFIFQCDSHEQHDGRVFYGERDACLYRLPLHYGKAHHEFGAKDAHTAWLDILEDYTPRELSDPADQLVAISALAELFMTRHSAQLGTYLFGHWTKFMHIDLNWSILEPVDRLKIDRAPSWSWASVDKALFETYVDKPPPATSDFLQVQSHLLDPTAPERLVIEVMLIPLQLSPVQDDTDIIECYLTRSLQSQIVGVHYPDYAEEKPVEWTEAYFIPLALGSHEVDGMFVKTTGAETYRRIGHFSGHKPVGPLAEIMRSTEKQIITLV